MSCFITPLQKAAKKKT